MKRISDTAWGKLVAAADRAQVPVVYCNNHGGNPFPVINEGCCSGCGERLLWVVPPGALSNAATAFKSGV